MAQRHLAGCADRRLVRNVRNWLVADFRRDATGEYRTWRPYRARSLHLPYCHAGFRHGSPHLVVACRARHGTDRLRAATRPAQLHPGRGSAATIAGDFWPLHHHPERATRIVHRRQPQAAGRCHRNPDIPAGAGSVDWRAAANSIRGRRGSYRGTATPVLPHSTWPRVTSDVRRSGRSSADRTRYASHLRAGDGPVIGGDRHRRRISGRTRQFGPSHRTRAADLRLRGGDHWPARQHVGNVGGRHYPRCLTSDRCANRPRLAAACRSHRVSRHPRRPAAGSVSQGVGMIVEHATRSSRIGVALIAIALVVLALAPYWGDRQTLRLLAEMFTFIALASLWNLLAGYAGLVSVGQQAFVGLGGYVLFALAMLLDVNPVLAIFVAGPIGALVAVPVALLIFRLRGAYFAIGTWVVAKVFRLLASHISVLGGGFGIRLPAADVPAMAPSRLMREFEMYWLALLLAVVILAAIFVLLRSRHGLALTAIRDNELAAQSTGIGVWSIKFTVYVLTAFGTAMVGAFIFLQKLRISPDTAFSVNDWTAFVIFITVIGGIGRIEGPIIGTIIFFALRQSFAGLGSLYLLMMGAVAIV